MKALTGKVVSTKMLKTIVVEVETHKLHPLYKKIMIRAKRYKVHCENSNVKVGDMVEIVTTSPFSKDKHFKLLKLLKIFKPA